MTSRTVALGCLLGLGSAQQAGLQVPEEHPPLSMQSCEAENNCQEEQLSIVMDVQRRWLHDQTLPKGYINCIKDEAAIETSLWDPKLCPDPVTCAQNCAYEGVSLADYGEKYGIRAVDRGVQLSFEEGANVGAQVQVLESENAYKMFRLKNKEISFDVDLSSLPCGLNAAFYLVAMSDSGQNFNGAGPKYGTGYCDAQCTHKLKFLQGEANMDDWNGAQEHRSGRYGACCTEIDIWEGNNQAAAFTAHPCEGGQTRCEGVQCGDTSKGEHYLGMCDKDGCDLNTYRLGARDFYGPGKEVDSMRPFTVVTQFRTTDGTDWGELAEIKQFYLQDGRVIEPPESQQQGVAGTSMSDGYCRNLKQAFVNTRDQSSPQGEFDQFTTKGGLGTIGATMDAGMVLVMSIWDDPKSQMRWLDSSEPVGASLPGVARGPCPVDQGDAAQVEAANPGASVTYSDIRYGRLGSTNPGLPKEGPVSPVVQPEPYRPPPAAMAGQLTPVFMSDAVPRKVEVGHGRIEAGGPQRYSLLLPGLSLAVTAALVGGIAASRRSVRSGSEAEAEAEAEYAARLVCQEVHRALPAAE